MLFFVAVFMRFGALYLYPGSRSRRIFILSLSMGVISLTAVAGFSGDKVTSISPNVELFKYIGQKGSFIFIFLRFFQNFGATLRHPKPCHITASSLLLILILLC